MGILDLLFVKTCLTCGKEGKYICEKCVDKVGSPRPICPECLGSETEGKTHSGCLNPQGLDGLTSIWNYEGVIRKAVLALKYKYADEIAKELGEHATRKLLLKNYFSANQTLIPIPLYWLRENQRGFNQTEVIGKIIARNMGWKIEQNLLVRTKLKSPQTELNRKERISNIQGVFSASSNFSRDGRLNFSKYPNVIIFDDVWTTGSTLKEAAKILKQVGAEKVWGITLAR